MKFSRQSLFKILLVLVNLHPWLLFGLAGPLGDGVTYLWGSAALVFGIPLPMVYRQIFQGPTPLLVPLIAILPGRFFFWICSALIAGISAWLILSLHAAFRRLFARGWVADVLALTLAFHPFLQQMNYWWMSEWLYIAGMLFAFILGIEAFESGSRKKFVAVSLIFGVATIIRTQTVLPLGLLVASMGLLSIIRKQKPFPWVNLAILTLGMPLVLAPFSLLKYARFGTFSLNQGMGFTTHLVLDAADLYRPANGPASRLLHERAQRIARSPENELKNLPTPPDHELVLKAAQRIALGGRLSFGDAHTISQVYFQEAAALDKEMMQVFREAVRAKFGAYRAYVWSQFKWYLNAASENPIEWHAAMISSHAEQVLSHWQIGKYDLEQQPAVGLGDLAPKQLFGAYSTVRNAFNFLMTWLKRLSLLALPASVVLLVSQKQWRKLQFLWLVAGTHFATIIFLSCVVGFVHRYALPFDAMCLVYIALVADSVFRRQKPTLAISS